MAGLALAHRSGRPALSSVRGLRAGAGGGEEGGKQRPRQGGVHPARPAGCGGPSWAAPPQQGGEPPAGHRGSSGAQGSRREMLGARWGVAGCPCRTWGSLWGGAPSVGRGGSSEVGRGPSPGRAAGLAKPRNSASAQGSWSAWRSGSRVRVQGYAGLLGQSPDPGVSGGSRVMLGTRGAQGSQGCAALQGARSGTSAAEGAAGRGSALRCPAAPEPGSEGRRAAARPLPGLRHAAPRPGGRERGGRESGAEPGRAGGWGRRAGEGRTRSGGRGAGAAAGRAGPQGVGASSAPGRGEAGSAGHGRRSLAPRSLSRSFPRTRAEGGKARSSHFPTFQTSQRNFFLSSPACASPSSLSFPLASSALGCSSGAPPPEGVRPDALLSGPHAKK